MSIKFTLTFILFLLIHTCIMATEPIKDTVIQLGEIKVSTSRQKNYAIGNRIQTIDTSFLKMYQSGSLVNLLQGASSLNVKAYGHGGLATYSVRGGSSSHTAVVWNGLAMDNPMSGSVNLSLLPSVFFESVNFQMGGSSTLYGSGPMNGILHLNNDAFNRNENNSSIEYTVGSFGQRRIALASKYGDENIAFSIKAYSQNVENNFSFYDRIERKNDIMQDAQCWQRGLMANLFIRTSEKSQLKSSAFYNLNKKNIQEQMGAVPNHSYQADQNLNWVNNWKYFGQKHLVQVKTGVFGTNLYFKDTTYGKNEVSDNSSLRLVLEFDDNISFKKNLMLNFGFNQTYEVGSSSGYTGKAERNRNSVFYSLKALSLFSRLDLVSGFRAEYVSGGTVVPVFSNSFSYLILDDLKFKGNVSSNYRLPSFNDLFWAETGFAKGNPDLVAETGNTYETSLHYSRKGKFHHGMIHVTGYYNTLNNKIVWKPGSDGRWMPDNVDNSYAYGLEAEAEFGGRINDFRYLLKAGYNYTVSYELNEGMEKQFSWYVPPVTFKMQENVSYKSFTLGCTYAYTSNRLYTNEKELDPYSLVDVYGGVKINSPLVFGQLSLNANNIFNTQYEVTAWYPMPGRYWSITLKLGMHNY